MGCVVWGTELWSHLHSHWCRRLGVEWLFHILWHSWAICCHRHVDKGDMQTKGTLHFHIKVPTPWKHINVAPVLAASALGLIGKNWLSIILMDWKPVHMWLHVCPPMSICMYVNSEREDGSLELSTGNINKETSFYNLGRKKLFYYFILVLPFIPNFFPYLWNNLNTRLS